MDSIFGVPWGEVEANHLEAFLADASGEGLIWEGKGTAPLSELRSKIVAGVCGLANQLGGFFIVGAEEGQRAWHLRGVPNDVAEDAHDWIARILIGNLANPPPFDVRRFDLGDERVAAIINVEQSPLPPCMTKQGVVYVRVVGETKRVTQPEILADLIRKGNAGRDAAEGRALRTVDILMDALQLVGQPDSLRFALALAPTAARSDYSARLFTPGFRDTVLAAAAVLERGIGDEHEADESEMGRDGYVVRRGRYRPGSWQWALQAWWDGSVAVEFASAVVEEGPRPPTVDVVLSQAWRAAAEPLAALTGIPDRGHVLTHLAIRMTEGFRLFDPQVPYALVVNVADRPIQRWASMDAPSQDQLSSVIRELTRSAGIEVFEPEDAEGAAGEGAGP